MAWVVRGWVPVLTLVAGCGGWGYQHVATRVGPHLVPMVRFVSFFRKQLVNTIRNGGQFYRNNVYVFPSPKLLGGVWTWGISFYSVAISAPHSLACTAPLDG